MGYSIFNGIGDFFTGGGKSLSDYIFGSHESDNAWDPGHFFTQSDSERLAEEQWEWQKEKYDQNFAEQRKWTIANWHNLRQQEAYQKWLNNLQMEREDNAVQRRVDDLKAAGLSPTLAAGSAAGATPVHAMSASQVAPPQYEVGTNPKLEAAMFKEQIAKDRMALAMSVMGNIADVSRTKAETELIRAQKDRYVAETPLELRLKSLSQELQESMNPLTVQMTKLNMDYQELKNVNEDLTRQIMESDVRLKAYDEVLKSWDAYFAPRQGEAKTKSLETEVKQKAVALEMSEFLRDKTKEAGVPLEMMSPAYKNYMSFLLHGKRQATAPNPNRPDHKPFSETTAGKIIKKIFTKSPRFVP